MDLPAVDENVEYVESANQYNPIIINVPHDPSNDLTNTDLFQPISATNDISLYPPQPTFSTAHNENNCSRKQFTPVTSVNWTDTPFSTVTNSQFTGSEELPADILGLDSAYQLFHYFFTDDLLDHICTETHKYSIQKNFKPFQINKIDLRRFLGICIMMSVQKNPSIRSYWGPNIGNDVI